MYIQISLAYRDQVQGSSIYIKMGIASLFIRYRLAFQMGGVKVFSGRDVNTLEVQEYDIDALARYLGIQTDDLPLLAALTGNDMGKE